MLDAVAADREIRKIVLPGQTPQGEHILAVLLKRSYDIVPSRPCVRAEKDAKLVPGDVHYDDPMTSSVRFESDFVPFKLATDVVFNARAYAPGGMPVYWFFASVTVGTLQKHVVVIGNRVAKYQDGGTPSFTDPQPVREMDIIYERAYGGVDIYSDPKVQVVYARNPLGRGFAERNVQRAVDNLLLPNIEDPADPITPERLCVGHFMHWERQPMPAGFGWVHKTWQPRGGLAGVMPADRATEQELRQVYAQFVPADQKQQYAETGLPDMDFRFFNGASTGLALPYLNGDEDIATTNLVPNGQLSWKLPGERPQLGLDIGDGVQEEPVVLHTVMVHVEQRRVDLLWRAAFPYRGPDWLPEMKRMEVFVQ
jgi:hypothetical protein